jgi:hypothetical protein
MTLCVRSQHFKIVNPMNRFGEIADEITIMIEDLMDPGGSIESLALGRTLKRAYTQACLADIEARHRVVALKLV